MAQYLADDNVPMKICVINPGVMHALSRTLAIAPYFREIHYLDCAGIHADDDSLNAKNIRYYGPRSLPAGKSAFLGFRKLLSSIAPEAIVCHYASGDYFFHAVGYNRCPVAAIAMGTDIQYDEGDLHVPPIRRLLTRMAVRACCCISAKSARLARRIRAYGYRGRLDVNLWGSDLSRFTPRDRGACRRRLGLPEGSPILLSPRAVEPRLNIELIVRSTASLKEKYPALQLVVLGRTQPAYRKHIEALIGELQLGPNVRLVYSVPQDALPDYFCAADVVVSMARSEGFPNTILETMACKVPNVVGRIPSVEEVLTDGENARLCDLNEADLTKTLDEVLTDPERCRGMVENAHRLAKKSADIHANGERFAVQLKQILLSGQRRPMRLLPSGGFDAVYIAYSLLRKLRLA